MKFTALSLAAWAAWASSTAIDVNKRASALEVTLEAVGNSKVKASVTNTASQGYNLFYKGSFLDSTAPVDKFVVSSSCEYPHQTTTRPVTNIYQQHELSSMASFCESQPQTAA